MVSMPYMGDVAETEPCVLAPVLRELVEAAEEQQLGRGGCDCKFCQALARAEAALKEAADE
jgi:hypothetical protein